MNKKVINFIGIFFIFLISFIIHNLYDMFPNVITLITSPINESIFEHMKMILTSYMLWIIIKYFINQKYDIKENNYLLKELLTTMFEITIFLIIFIPIYNHFGENLLLTLLIYFITIVISQILNYFIKFKNRYKISNLVSLIIIITIYILTTYLSYNPPKYDFFKDPINNTYGLNK